MKYKLEGSQRIQINVAQQKYALVKKVECHKKIAIKVKRRSNV